MPRLFDPFNHLKLKYKLIIFILLSSLLTLVFFSLVSVPLMKRQTEENERTKARENMKTFQFFLDSNLANMRSGLYASLSNPAFSKWYTVYEEEEQGTMSPEVRLSIHNDCYNAMLDSSRAYPYITSIFLLDRDNHCFSIYSDVSPVIPTSFSSLPAAQHAREASGQFIWEFSSEEGVLNGILLARAVYELITGDFLGYYVVTLDMRILDPFLSMGGAGRGTYSIETDGVIWNSPDGATLENADAPRPVNGDYTVTMPDPVTGWNFSYSVSKETLYLPVARMERAFYTASLFAVAIAVLLSLLLSDLFNRRIQRLLERVRQVEEYGAPETLLDDPYRDEIGILTRRFNELLNSLKRSQHMQRENIFRSLLEGTYDPSMQSDAASTLQLETDGGMYQVVLVSFLQGGDLPYSHWGSRVDALCPKGLTGILLRPSLLCFLSTLKERDTSAVFPKMLQLLEADLGFSSTRAFFGGRYPDILLVKKSLEDAIVLLNYRAQNSPQQLYCYDNLTFSSDRSGYPHMLEQKLMQSIEACNLLACEKLLREISDYFISNESEVYYASFFLSSVYLKLYKLLTDNAMHPEMLYGERWRTVLDTYSNSLDILSRFTTLYQDIKLYFNQLNHLRQNLSVTQNETIRKALLLISSEYHTPELNITYLSEKLNLSEKYFSALFKKEMSSGFSEYLTGYRIDKSKELLKNTDKKVKEVSAEVGFEYTHYFCSVFKSATGATPTEYRKLSRGGQS